MDFTNFPGDLQKLVERDVGKQIRTYVRQFLEKPDIVLGLMEKHGAVITGDIPLWILLTVLKMGVPSFFPKKVEICIPHAHFGAFVMQFASSYTILSSHTYVSGWTPFDTDAVTRHFRYISECVRITTAERTWKLIRSASRKVEYTAFTKPTTSELNLLTHNMLISVFPKWTAEGKTCLYGDAKHVGSGYVEAKALAKGFITCQDGHEVSNTPQTRRDIKDSDVPLTKEDRLVIGY
ncbi:hypothetical protein NLI96_g4568 [Meripilus lineatus]|uniref:Uncharacterized protein n=1 Tax=Meripilus lineatus TaxID=2056292 RepID=A0AAD5V4C2_9APHY|nr:hypothetical protein NLI96_g4568 [Physisporinus lineatus]